MRTSTTPILAVSVALLLVLAGAWSAGLGDLLLRLRGRALVIAGLAGGRSVRDADGVPAAQETPHVEEQFLIPMHDGKLARYLRTTVVVELYDLETRDELRANAGRFRDAFILGAADLDAQTLDGPAGLDRCRTLVRAAVKHASPQADVRGVYLSEFLIHGR
jgi:flagellar basal body-associated protein FliL